MILEQAFHLLLILHMNSPLKIGILGIGNLLVSDEGFGVHFINYLNSRYILPDNVSILDGGTAGIMLAPFIEDVDLLYVIDTVAIKAEPGSIHCFSDKDVRSGNIHTRLSPHQVGLLEILDLGRLRGKAPERVVMMTVVPDDLSINVGLSPRLKPKLDEIMTILKKSLSSYNILPIPKKQTAGA